jgi:hypothetical protein
MAAPDKFEWARDYYRKIHPSGPEPCRERSVVRKSQRMGWAYDLRDPDGQFVCAVSLTKLNFPLCYRTAGRDAEFSIIPRGEWVK